MAYDEGLATRIQELLPHGQEKKMFGGWGLMHRGNLVVGVIGDDMIARVGPEATESTLLLEHVRPFDFTGRPMKGWVVVEAAGVSEDADLAAWVQRCKEFTDSLPAK
jgi:hypothetical protein